MDKKIIAILRKLFLLNWPYEFTTIPKSGVVTISIINKYSTCQIACSLIAVKVMLSSEKNKLYFKLKLRRVLLS